MRLKLLWLLSFFSFSLIARTMFLFDVDGTLTMLRQKIEKSMFDKSKEN